MSSASLVRGRPKSGEKFYLVNFRIRLSSIWKPLKHRKIILPIERPCKPGGGNIRPAKEIFFSLKGAFLTAMWPARHK